MECGHYGDSVPSRRDACCKRVESGQGSHHCYYNLRVPSHASSFRHHAVYKAMCNGWSVAATFTTVCLGDLHILPGTYVPPHRILPTAPSNVPPVIQRIGAVYGRQVLTVAYYHTHDTLYARTALHRHVLASRLRAYHAIICPPISQSGNAVRDDEQGPSCVFTSSKPPGVPRFYR